MNNYNQQYNNEYDEYYEGDNPYNEDQYYTEEQYDDNYENNEEYPPQLPEAVYGIEGLILFEENEYLRSLGDEQVYRQEVTSLMMDLEDKIVGDLDVYIVPTKENGKTDFIAVIGRELFKIENKFSIGESYIETEGDPFMDTLDNITPAMEMMNLNDDDCHIFLVRAVKVYDASLLNYDNI